MIKAGPYSSLQLMNSRRDQGWSTEEERVSRGKRLSRSNIIGEKGELLFRDWALEHQLAANKATIDIGIDFFCQVAEPVPAPRP